VPHYYPVVVPAGRSVAGDSLGFHAYSLRVDNCTNQWYLEESSLAYIPPYSLGMCLRLYGTGVAILLAQAPVGQPQLAPIAGEQLVSVYSDQLRTEVPAAAIRQFSFIQSVSDLTEGPQPARPPTGTDRLYADTTGNIHHLHADGTDLTLYDGSNIAPILGGFPVGGDARGTISSIVVSVQNSSRIFGHTSDGVEHQYLSFNGNVVSWYNVGGNYFEWITQDGSVVLAALDNSGNLNLQQGALLFRTPSTYLTFNGTNFQLVGAPLSFTPAVATIPTSGLAAGAAQAMIGSFSSSPSFSSATTGTWLATAITTGSVACSGALCRFELSTSVAHTVAGSAVSLGLFMDGVIWQTFQTYTNVPIANQFTPVCNVLYATPAAGNHTFTLGAYNWTAGTVFVGSNNLNSSLWVNEQRR
jgi:hypothetical protein